MAQTDKRKIRALANMNRSNVIHCMPFSLNCCVCTSKTWFYFWS